MSIMRFFVWCALLMVMVVLEAHNFGNDYDENSQRDDDDLVKDVSQLLPKHDKDHGGGNDDDDGGVIDLTEMENEQKQLEDTRRQMLEEIRQSRQMLAKKDAEAQLSNARFEQLQKTHLNDIGANDGGMEETVKNAEVRLKMLSSSYKSRKSRGEDSKKKKKHKQPLDFEDDIGELDISSKSKSPSSPKKRKRKENTTDNKTIEVPSPPKPPAARAQKSTDSTHTRVHQFDGLPERVEFALGNIGTMVCSCHFREKPHLPKQNCTSEKPTPKQTPHGPVPVVPPPTNPEGGDPKVQSTCFLDCQSHMCKVIYKANGIKQWHQCLTECLSACYVEEDDAHREVL